MRHIRLRASLVLAISLASCSPGTMSECASNKQGFSAMPRPEGFPTSSATSVRLREAITTPDQWQAFWSAVMADRGSPRGAPPVDFQQKMVLAAAMGRRTTGGYFVSIDEATSDVAASRLNVRVREVSPGKMCAVSQSLSSPIDAVLVPNSNYQVRFVEEQCVFECPPG